MVHKTKFWVILFALIFLLGLGAFLLLRGGGSGDGRIARVWLNNEIIEEIDLNAVAVPYEFDVTTELGTNRVRVEHGSIQVVSADCPDQTCVNMGAISGGYVPIACVPHRLVIDILTED